MKGKVSIFQWARGNVVKYKNVLLRCASLFDKRCLTAIGGLV